MFNPDDEFPFKVPDEVLNALGEAIEEDARKLGLYMVGIALNVTVSDTDPPAPILLATFQVGDVAFSERVQNPQADAVSDELRALEHDFKNEEFEEMKRKYREAIERGENPWDVV